MEEILALQAHIKEGKAIRDRMMASVEGLNKEIAHYEEMLIDLTRDHMNNIGADKDGDNIRLDDLSRMSAELKMLQRMITDLAGNR